MKHVTDDILDTPLRYIAHGCNAQGSMGAGVAKAIRNRWPGSFERYKKDLELWESMGKSKPEMLGEVSIWKDRSSTQKTIFSCITQEKFGLGGNKFASYTAVALSLTKVVHHIKLMSDVSVPSAPSRLALPMIGCGYGGLKWSIMKELLGEIEDMNPGFEFWVYQKPET